LIDWLLDEGGAALVSGEHVDTRPLLRRLARVAVDDISYTVLKAPEHGRLAVAGQTTGTLRFQFIHSIQRSNQSTDLLID